MLLARAFLLVTCLATEWALRPWLGLGLASLDLPVLYVLWLAQREPLRCVVLAGALLCCLRATFGIDTLVLLVVPLLVSVLVLLLVRRRFNLRELWFQVPWTAAGMAVFILIDELLRHRTLAVDFFVAAMGAVIAGLAVPVFFPVLDACLSPPRATR